LKKYIKICFKYWFLFKFWIAKNLLWKKSY